MAIRQTYESHLVGVGSPMTGEKFTGAGPFTDSIRFLPFAQGMAYSYAKDIARIKSIGVSTTQYNSQINWSEVSVNISQFDYFIDSAEYNSIFQDVNIHSRDSDIGTGVSTALLSDLLGGGRDQDGAAIYFLTDTGQFYRDQIANEDNYQKQYTIIDPCYLSSVAWTASVGNIASFNFQFIGNYVAEADVATGSNILSWQVRRPLSSGSAMTGQVDVSSGHATGAYIDIESSSGLFPPDTTTVAGAPDFGEIRGISWTLPIERGAIQGLGNPMVYDRKAGPISIGAMSIEYNYEGQEIDGSSFIDTTYDITITNTNKLNNIRIYNIQNAILENIQLNSAANGEPDSYTAEFSFVATVDAGITTSWNTSP